jgi:hypothetical protein
VSATNGRTVYMHAASKTSTFKRPEPVSELRKNSTEAEGEALLVVENPMRARAQELPLVAAPAAVPAEPLSEQPAAASDSTASAEGAAAAPAAPEAEAAALAAAPLPPGWKTRISASTGRIVYSNAALKISTFDRPA